MWLFFILYSAFHLSHGFVIIIITILLDERCAMCDDMKIDLSQSDTCIMLLASLLLSDVIFYDLCSVFYSFSCSFIFRLWFCSSNLMA